MKLIFNGEYVKNSQGEIIEAEKIIKDNYKKQIKFIGGNSSNTIFVGGSIFSKSEVVDGDFTIESSNIEDLKIEIQNLKILLSNFAFNEEQTFYEKTEQFNSGETEVEIESLDNLDSLEE